MDNIKVKKRNGFLEDFNPDKINRTVERACQGLEGVFSSEIILDSKISFYNKIKTEEIDKNLILTARQKIYKEPNYSYVATRLLLNYIYKEAFKESVDSDTFYEDYKSSFIKNIKRGVKGDVYSKSLLDIFDLKRLSCYLKPERDLIFRYVGIQNIYDRYLIRLNGKVIETPQAYYMRVAMGLSLNEPDPNKQAEDFYDVFSQHLASPSTPTLFNSGTVSNQLSSCYLSEIDDSIDGIFDGLWQEARKSKYAGGLGFHVTKIRGSGSHIKGTNGKSGGLIPWLKIYNDMLVACDQAGKRRGSGCAYLEPWHIDVEDFLELRKETGEERRRCHDLNTALWCPDLFLKRVENRKKWTLFCPSEVPDLPELFGEKFEDKYLYYEKEVENGKIKNFRVVEAIDLWKKILKSLFETSHPWITFKDVSNRRYSSLHEGVLHGSNLCTEILRHTKHSKYKDGAKTEIGETAVCNLSSICLPNHLVFNNDKAEIDRKLLRDTIYKTIRALDNVIDINFYPTQEAGYSNFRHRPIGMGTMGWADVFSSVNILPDSDEAIAFTDELMEYISYCAIEASWTLAKERGAHKSFKGSSWSYGILPINTYIEYKKENNQKPIGKIRLDWDKLSENIKNDGIRNSSVLAIAPNASIAYQLGCEQSIEPNYKVLFRYENKSGNYYIVNFNFVKDMKKEGLWSNELAEAVKSVSGDVSLLDIPEKYKKKYSTAFDRDQFKLIEVNAVRQKWVDQGISFNLYNGTTSLKFLSDIYMHAWKQGLKTTYYLRNKAASEIQMVTVESKDEFYKLLADAKAKAEAGENCEMCQG